MAAVLFDTNAISDLMRNHPPVIARLALHRDPLATCTIVQGEIRYGLSRLPIGKKRKELEGRARSALTSFQIELVTEPIAETYGNLRAMLEKQGLNVEDNDLWIAATALTLGMIVVTHDHIFTRIPGLQVEDWSV